MTRFLHAAGWFFVVLLVLVLAAALAVSKLYVTEALVIVPHPPEVVDVQKDLWLAGDPVPDIYGVPASEKQRLLFVDENRLMRPPEDPSLRLLPVNKDGGHNPIQEKTMWFYARLAAYALGFGSFLSFVGWWLLSRRAARKRI